MLLDTGAELREGESTYLAALEFRINQATDLVINDYNAEMDNMEQLNQSILLAIKGTGEAFKGDLTARTETIKGFASLLSTAKVWSNIMAVLKIYESQTKVRIQLLRLEL